VSDPTKSVDRGFVDSDPPIALILVSLFVFVALFIGMAFEFSGLRARGTAGAQVPAASEALAAVAAHEASSMDPSRLQAAMEQVAGDAKLLEGLESADPGAEVASDEDPLVTKGRELYASKTCIACHSLDGTKGVGPSWKDVFGKDEKLADGSTVTVDDAYLRESIKDPMLKIVAGFAPAMPPLPLEDLELDALVAFIKAQTKDTASEGDGAAPE
jgi:mono/diheme cytochrome c family protein